MKIIPLAFLSISIAFSAFASENSSIGYKTVELALKALKSKEGINLSSQGGWTIIEDKEDSNLVLWSFTPDSHPAHPAAIKRKVVERNQKIYIQMSALCQAKKEDCDKLMQEFEQLNQNIMKGSR
ncbi:molecular chaperone DnaJ [Pseudomonas sp. 21C1]|uniref:molecular chaperone DnaJ n=1 Tax=Pseudomonas TaxID=286 RepID=UPI00084AC7FF|nr:MULTISPECIES: molecular chaperone DnaJ [Pseudomonas]OEC35682.1 molecular chaperone DnaJ [Pseudomonas sp. 21C1]